VLPTVDQDRIVLVKCEYRPCPLHAHRDPLSSVT
jgi:hypothetical protein